MSATFGSVKRAGLLICFCKQRTHELTEKTGRMDKEHLRNGRGRIRQERILEKSRSFKESPNFLDLPRKAGFPLSLR